MRIKKEGVALVILFAALFLSTMALAVDCPIPDTGQTKCYDDSGEITCPESGEPFYGQDAQYPCNPQSYTKLDANGNDLPESATEWVMVRDNVTGLIWEVKTDDGSIHDKYNSYTWYDAQDVFIATLNTQNFGGYNDWRLPSVKELSIIVDNGRPPGTVLINTAFFPNTVSVSSLYWSSTTYASHIAYRWIVHFDNGFVYNYHYSTPYRVRAVRAGQCGSFGNFEDNGDGTVTDNSTGLMWEVKTAEGGFRDWQNQYTWQEALSYCEDLSLANYDDWRLPNRNELQSLVDYSQYSPSIDTTFFPYAVSSTYWSSTPSWTVLFYIGSMIPGGGGYVRAVRGGQCGSSGTSTTTIPGSTTTTIFGSTTTTIPVSTTTTTDRPCPSKKVYGEYSEETELLRYFRDSVLSQTPEGREIIRLYYEWSPVIVQEMEKDEEFKKGVKEIIDEVLELITKAE